MDSSSAGKPRSPYPSSYTFPVATPCVTGDGADREIEHDIVNGHSKMDYQPRHSPMILPCSRVGVLRHLDEARGQRSPFCG